MIISTNIMKILIFTEGTILMHKNAIGHSREDIIKQVKEDEESVSDFASYVPIGKAAKKLKNWNNQGAEILYLTSRTKPDEIEDVKNVLRKFGFPEGQLLFRKKDEEYKNIAEKIKPRILIEDDCEGIGGEEMTITHLNPEIKEKIKSIIIKEFSGIDQLPDKVSELLHY
jgi:hypothetical protein